MTGKANVMGEPHGSVVGLGIESSCDETSVAVVKDGNTILSHVVYSQIDEHSPFRGVVPEIASRAHLEKINHVYGEAMARASLSPEELDYAAVTTRPGLVGSLMMGALFAKSLHLVYGTPLIGVDHVEAHMYAVTLEGVKLPYPFLGLLLSGGNSTIYRVEGPGRMSVIADTEDDACGEAFDKVAAIVKLPYPGGPPIEKEARLWQPSAREGSLFPRLLRNRPETDMKFSFSGIKTAVLRAHGEGADVRRICHDFQETVFELVERILLRAVRVTGIRSVVASGGVLANGSLRETLNSLGERENINVYYPESRMLCTDNGAMVGALGYALWKQGVRSEPDLPVSSKRDCTLLPPK